MIFFEQFFYELTDLYKISVGGRESKNCQPSHKLILILCFYFVDLKILK